MHAHEHLHIVRLQIHKRQEFLCFWVCFINAKQASEGAKVRRGVHVAGARRWRGGAYRRRSMRVLTMFNHARVEGLIMRMYSQGGGCVLRSM